MNPVVDLSPPVRPISRSELSRYFLASLVALAVDMALLVVISHYLSYLVAATIGFVAGAWVSYLLSTRWVFRQRRLADQPRTEFAAYFLVGIFGLGLNNGAIYMSVEYFALPLPAAKLGAAVATFFFNYLVRKHGLFSHD